MILTQTQQPQTSSPANNQLQQVTSTSKIPDPSIQPLTWLWPGRIPQGKLTLLDGSPNCGTTLFSITLAAHVSTGQPWPDNTPCPHGKVLLITPHDDFRDTLLPRLKTAGARESHILSFTHISDPSPNTPQRTRPFSFARDLSLLERAITTQDITLLIIDPYTALPGWRRALPVLIEMAQRTNCAIVLTRSLSRAPSNPLYPRCPASTALTAARSHLLLAPDPRDERHCLLLTPKHSLSAAPPILAYTIIASHNQPLLSWLPTPDPLHLYRLCTGPIRSPHRRAILQFLHECPDPRPIKDILAATSYDYEAGRKMLLRMSQAGELISLDNSLYTTANHPCLSNRSPDSPSPSSTIPNSLQNVPTRANHDELPPNSPTTSSDSLQIVPTVPTDFSINKQSYATPLEAAASHEEHTSPPSNPAPQSRPSHQPSDPLMQMFKQMTALDNDIFARVQAATRLAQKNKQNVPITPTGSQTPQLLKL